jgi:hypothetical protein
MDGEHPDFVYSGVIKKTSDPLSDDYLWVRVQRSVGEGRVVSVQSTSKFPVEVILQLTEQQARGLCKCLHNALERMAGREP